MVSSHYRKQMIATGGVYNVKGASPSFLRNRTKSGFFRYSALASSPCCCREKLMLLVRTQAASELVLGKIDADNTPDTGAAIL